VAMGADERLGEDAALFSPLAELGLWLSAFKCTKVELQYTVLDSVARLRGGWHCSAIVPCCLLKKARLRRRCLYL
jgi:hypothetical protein